MSTIDAAIKILESSIQNISLEYARFYKTWICRLSRQLDTLDSCVYSGLL